MDAALDEGFEVRLAGDKKILRHPGELLSTVRLCKIKGGAFYFRCANQFEFDAGSRHEFGRCFGGKLIIHLSISIQTGGNLSRSIFYTISNIHILMINSRLKRDDMYLLMALQDLVEETLSNLTDKKKIRTMKIIRKELKKWIDSFKEARSSAKAS